MVKISLKAGLCGDRFMESRCGDWLTNGHWMVRKTVCKILKSTPELTHKDADCKGIITGIRHLTFLPVELLPEIVVNACQPLVAKDGNSVTAWSGKDYEEILQLGRPWAVDDTTIVAVLLSHTKEFKPEEAVAVPSAGPGPGDPGGAQAMKPILLIGLPGCGKTLKAKQMAREILDWDVAMVQAIQRLARLPSNLAAGCHPQRPLPVGLRDQYVPLRVSLQQNAYRPLHLHAGTD